MPALPSRYNGGVPFRIRQFEKGDFETLWRIDQACFVPELAYSRPELAFYMRRGSAFTLVAEDEAKRRLEDGARVGGWGAAYQPRVPGAPLNGPRTRAVIQPP